MDSIAAKPAFCLKTKDLSNNRKIFVNFCLSDQVMYKLFTFLPVLFLFLPSSLLPIIILSYIYC